jgi:DNA-binding PadR family transcriptional regulator
MRTALTELESCVLGVIWRDGPLTAYEIAALFARSLSPYWSGSAGAIYPAVHRLRSRGFVRGARRSWNGRQKTVLAATRTGVAQLRGWLAPPLPAEAVAPSHDPLRTRLFFVNVLAAPQRKRFFDDVERALRGQLEAVKRQHARELAAGDLSEALGSLGVLYELRARLRWLREVRKRASPRAADS